MKLLNTLLAILLISLTVGCSSQPPVAPAETRSEFTPSPGKYGITAQTLSLQIRHQPGAAGTWNLADGTGAIVGSFASRDAALDALFANPANGRHVVLGLDLDSGPAADMFLEEMLAYSDAVLSNPAVQATVATATTDPASLTDDQRWWYETFYLPHLAVRAQLEDIAASSPVAGKKVLGLLRKLWNAIKHSNSDDDRRFEDHDGDGVPNARDKNYRGLLWRNGTIRVDAEGGDEISISLDTGCWDPCASGIPMPGC